MESDKQAFHGRWSDGAQASGGAAAPFDISFVLDEPTIAVEPAAAKLDDQSQPGPLAAAEIETVSAAPSVGGVPVIDLGNHSPPAALLALRSAVVGLPAGGAVLVVPAHHDFAEDLAAAGKVAGLIIAAADSSGRYMVRKK